MLSQRMQCNLLYRYFVMREPVTIEPNALVEPWRQIFLLAEREERDYWVIEGYDPLRSAALTIANKDRDVAQRWIDAIYASAEPIHFPTLAEMADSLEPVSWLWENWVPRGMLSILGAFQGAGKSYFVMDLARIVLHGPA
ncbi:MAG: AAA family ATPase [Anaerolineae bacterium]|nr:AAA family ATPase [Anaerolineae bacterium]